MVKKSNEAARAERGEPTERKRVCVADLEKVENENARAQK